MKKTIGRKDVIKEAKEAAIKAPLLFLLTNTYLIYESTKDSMGIYPAAET
ncbi:hypothetical protein OSO01_07760 [Oceanobacillus sojae]|uniref:Uncharacterized protein n=1 Tax=Oceanobacillus sojae TaxID=582851 RepID=A0A511ZF16_9BACI|nr:hypothetical protein OSO01_07760 [Oceanobacillus sojae]